MGLSGGGTPTVTHTWNKIAEHIAVGAAATVQFAAVPYYRYYKIIAVDLVCTNTPTTYYIQFNGDAAANYNYGFLNCPSGAPAGAASTVGTYIPVAWGTNTRRGGFEITIGNQAAGVVKSVQSTGGTTENMGVSVGWWNNVAAVISQIDITATLGNMTEAGTRLMLLGMNEL